MQYLRPTRAFAHDLRATIRLALPLIGGTIATLGMTAVDTTLAGHLSAHALGSVAVGAALFHLALVSVIGVNAAVAPSVAQLDGGGRRTGIGPLFVQALAIAAVLGLLLMAATAYGLPHLATLLGLPPDLAQGAAAFLGAAAPAIPALSLFHACRGLSEGLAMPRPTMMFGLLGLLLLIPVGYALMYGAFGLPGLGVRGCGLANSLVAWAQAGGFVLWLRCSGRYRGLGWGAPVRLDRPAIADLLRIGVPMAVSLLMESGLFSGAGLAIARLGTLAEASHQVALNVAVLCFALPLGLSLATTVRVGQAAGRHDQTAVRRAGLAGMALALLVQSASGTTLLLAPDAIARLYTDDPAVQAGAAVLLRIAGVFQLADGLQVTAAGALRGLKDTRVPMLLTAAAYWGVGMPLGLALAFAAGWQAPGMWCGLVAGLVVVAALLASRFLRLARVQ